MVNAVSAATVVSAAVAGVTAMAVAAVNVVIVPSAPSVHRVTAARARSGNALQQVMLRNPQKPKAARH